MRLHAIARAGRVRRIKLAQASSSLPVVVQPDEIQANGTAAYAVEHEGPLSLRLSRRAPEPVSSPEYRSQPGRPVAWPPGAGVAILAPGGAVSTSPEAVGRLAADRRHVGGGQRRAHEAAGRRLERRELPRSMTSLDGRVALVTGAGGERGFGRAIARRLARAGADVVVTDLAPRGVRVVPTKPDSGWRGIEDTAGEIENEGRRALALTLDVRAASQIDTVIARALATFGRLDILVNNAAAPPGADRVPVVELSEEAWDLVLDTNLKGTYLCARAAAAAMLRQQRGGRIINMSSNCGKLGYPRLAAYCASKFGVIGFTQALAMELAPARITVNAICPGAADTDRLDYLGRRPDGSFDPKLRAAAIGERAAAIPLGRLATIDDVAELTAFLASDAADYITAQAINVAGGSVTH